MGSDFIPDPQGLHQHSLEWPVDAPMYPPVSAPVSIRAWSLRKYLKPQRKYICMSKLVLFRLWLKVCTPLPCSAIMCLVNCRGPTDPRTTGTCSRPATGHSSSTRTTGHSCSEFATGHSSSIRATGHWSRNQSVMPGNNFNLK